ncbi:hypothetical protein GWK47_038966 [Chionoecetes opilio]|uniref:Uncharacterized protein n=1 Tax=Chionoecetes opilio TaxID=41210 RepID=A0A8J4YC15_CHIOP|nr:hypothetical protein GWK47_038966 [Chionoecetes opilio]
MCAGPSPLPKEGRGAPTRFPSPIPLHKAYGDFFPPLEGKKQRLTALRGCQPPLETREVPLLAAHSPDKFWSPGPLASPLPLNAAIKLLLPPGIRPPSPFRLMGGPGPCPLKTGENCGGRGNVPRFCSHDPPLNPRHSPLQHLARGVFSHYWNPPATHTQKPGKTPTPLPYRPIALLPAWGSLGRGGHSPILGGGWPSLREGPCGLGPPGRPRFLAQWISHRDTYRGGRAELPLCRSKGAFDSASRRHPPNWLPWETRDPPSWLGHSCQAVFSGCGWGLHLSLSPQSERSAAGFILSPFLFNVPPPPPSNPTSSPLHLLSMRRHYPITEPKSGPRKAMLFRRQRYTNDWGGNGGLN